MVNIEINKGCFCRFMEGISQLIKRDKYYCSVEMNRIEFIPEYGYFIVSSISESVKREIVLKELHHSFFFLRNNQLMYIIVSVWFIKP